MGRVRAEDVKGQVSITRLLDYLQLETNRSGFMVCPFHGDNDPSLRIYPETNSFYCFGCGAGSSVIDFYMHWSGLGFYEAVQELGKIFGLVKETLTRAEQASRYLRMKKNKPKLGEYEYWLNRYYDCLAVLDREHNADIDSIIGNKKLERACQNIAYAEYRLELADGTRIRKNT